MSQLIYVPSGVLYSHAHVVHPNSPYQSGTDQSHWAHDPLTSHMRWFGLDPNSSAGMVYSNSFLKAKLFPHDDLSDWVKEHCERPVLIQPQDVSPTMYDQSTKIVFTEGFGRRSEFEQWLNSLGPRQHKFTIKSPHTISSVTKFFHLFTGVYEIVGNDIFIRDKFQASKFVLEYSEFLQL